MRKCFLVIILSIHRQGRILRRWKECGEVLNGETRNRGTARHHLESYFAEFMWRKMIGDGDVFEEVMIAWGKYWELE